MLADTDDNKVASKYYTGSYWTDDKCWNLYIMNGMFQLHN